MSNLLPVPATVVDIRQLTDKERLFTIRLDNGRTFKHRPCQFVMVSMIGIGEAPISISSPPLNSGETLMSLRPTKEYENPSPFFRFAQCKQCPSPLRGEGWVRGGFSGETFEICVRSVGNLTGAMHRLCVNDRIGIRGPYGNGFPVEKIEGKDVLIAAGGLGLAPIRSLIKYILQDRERYGRVILLIGFKRPEDILFKEDVASWEENPSIETHITVDIAEPSWRRHVGVITELFKYLDLDPLKTIASVVGPPVMYRFVIRELLSKGIFEGNIFLDLERRMRCGIGKCGHCQINGIYLCQNGPVLSYIEAKKLQEAL